MKRAALQLGLLCTCLAVLAGAAPFAAPREGDEKTIFIAVVDAGGRPAAGLTAADFAVREDGVDREVIGARLSTEPLHLALLADTTGGAARHVQPIRAGLKAFIDRVLAANAGSRIALWEFGEAPRRLSDFTDDGAKLGREVGRLFPRSQSGSFLLDTIHDASQALARTESRRRAIVVLSVDPADEQSQQDPKKIADVMARSRAQLWGLSLQNGVAQNGRQDLIINMFMRNAGGRRDAIVSDTGIEAGMRQLAAVLTTQYELTYRRPSGAAKVVQTGIRRDGLRIIAGLVAPQ